MALRFFALRSLFILFLMRGIRFLYSVGHKMCALCKFSLLGALRSFAAVELFFVTNSCRIVFSRNAHEIFRASAMAGFKEWTRKFLSFGDGGFQRALTHFF